MAYLKKITPASVTAEKAYADADAEMDALVTVIEEEIDANVRAVGSARAYMRNAVYLNYVEWSDNALERVAEAYRNAGYCVKIVRPEFTKDVGNGSQVHMLFCWSHDGGKKEE